MRFCILLSKTLEFPQLPSSYGKQLHTGDNCMTHKHALICSLLHRARSTGQQKSLDILLAVPLEFYNSGLILFALQRRMECGKKAGIPCRRHGVTRPHQTQSRKHVAATKLLTWQRTCVTTNPDVQSRVHHVKWSKIPAFCVGDAEKTPWMYV